MSSDRNTYFDFLKGIAIIMVVGIHTIPAVSGFNSFGESITILIRLLLNCAVPLFLALSGWFLAQKPLDNRHDIIGFYKKRLPRVYIPLLVWGMGWFALGVWREPTSWGVVKNLFMLFTGGFAIYYFVALIMQCYIVTPFLTKYYGGGIWTCSVLSATAITLTSWLVNVEGRSFPLLLYAGPIYLLGVFYMLGIWLRKHEDTSYFIIGLMTAVIGYILQILECSYYMSLHGGGLGLKISSAIFSTGIILLLVSKRRATLFKENSFTKAVAWVGKVSFGVYLLHIYVVFILDTIIGSMSWLSGWGLSFTLTIAIIFLAKRMFPERFTYNFLGF